MRLDLEQIEQLGVPDDDLKHEALVRDELDDDKLRDEILPRDTKRLADDASLPEKPGRLEDRANDGIHPPRLLGDVEHDGGDRLRPRVEDRLHVHVEAPVLGGKPPEHPERRDNREDRPEQRRADEELDDDEDESGDGELLGLNGTLLEDEVVTAVHTRAVDNEGTDQEPNDR